MSYKPSEAKAVSTSFQGFLWTAIGKIWEAEDEGDMLTALSRACSLVKYLPKQVKLQLEDDVNQITVLVNQNFNLESSNFHSAMLLRNKSIDTVAKKYLKVFMNKLMTLLDDRGVYMEYHRREVQSNVSNVSPQFFEQQPPATPQP